MSRWIIHIKNILFFIEEPVTRPIPLYIDSESSTEVLSTLKSNNQLKHIMPRINFIRECINNSLIILIFIPSEYNVADVLTKPLPTELFNRHKNKLLNGFSCLTGEQAIDSALILTVTSITPETK